MESYQKNEELAQEESRMSMKDWLDLCLANWKWFLLSAAVALATGLYYILSVEPVYERSASVMIKEDSKGQTIGGDVASMFSDLGMSGGQANVHNELLAIQSPEALLETGKRLSLDVDYHAKGTFHNTTLYGKDLPVRVIFYGLPDNASAGFTLKLEDGDKVELSKFARSGRKDLPDEPVTGKIGAMISTPAGRVTIVKADGYAGYIADGNRPILVSRTSLHGMADRIKGNLTASMPEKQATIIDLAYKDVEPQRAVDVLNTLIEVYKESWVKDKNQVIAATSAFITDRLGVIERELGDVDEDISSYKSAHMLPDLEATSALNLTQSKETGNRILALSTRAAIARYIRGYLAKGENSDRLLPANSGIDENGSNSGIEAQIAEYNKVQLQRNNLVANSSERNPLVADYDQSLASLRKAIISSIDNLSVALDTQIRRLEQDESKTNSQIASNPNQAKYLQSVGRQQKVKESLYLFLLQKREENELSQAFTAYNTRIICPPTGSETPIAPVGRNIMLMALAAGLLIPVGVLVAREGMDTKIRGKKDIEGLSLPFIGEIPYCQPEGQRKGWKLWKKTHDVDAIVVKEGRRDVENEAFRVLRTNFEFMTGANGKGNVVVLTSFNVGSGKSFLTMNMAASLAIKKKRVLVIDGDLRKGTSSSYLGVHRHKGLSDYLSGRVGDVHGLIIEDATQAKFDMLTVGTIPPNPTELLFSDRFPEMIGDLRKSYDYILIDCPPIEIVADTQIIEKYADRTIFVIRAGLFERAMLPELESLYKERKFKSMSLILNGTSRSGSRYGGAYRYGYGYGGGQNYYGSDRIK